MTRAAAPIRRRMRAAAIALASSCAVLHACAAAPFAHGQAPGYYRMMLGDYQVTALLDGTSPLPPAMVVQPEAETRRAMAAAFIDGEAELSTSAYLINTGDRLILVDTGAGRLLAPTLGKLLANLRSSGYAPEQVDDVYLTHLHPDHIGGLMDGDRLAFPRATVHADRRDPDLWLNRTLMDAAPPEGMNGQRRFRWAMLSLNGYIAAGRFRTFDGATQLSPGLRSIPAPGHTPGHTLYAIESRGQKLVLWGDLVGFEPVQLAQPDVPLKFDTDGTEAAAVRRKFLEQASREGYWVAGAHLSFPGIGHVRRERDHYEFVPTADRALD